MALESSGVPTTSILVGVTLSVCAPPWALAAARVRRRLRDVATGTQDFMASECCKTNGLVKKEGPSPWRAGLLVGVHGGEVKPFATADTASSKTLRAEGAVVGRDARGDADAWRRWEGEGEGGDGDGGCAGDGQSPRLPLAGTTSPPPPSMLAQPSSPPALLRPAAGSHLAPSLRRRPSLSPCAQSRRPTSTRRRVCPEQRRTLLQTPQLPSCG